MSEIPGNVEEIRVASDIVDIIGSYFPLESVGRNSFTALCPFHDEANPSFVADRDSQTFHCAGCGAEGDVFRFVMRYEHVDLVRSLEKLAARAGVRLETPGDGDLPPQHRPAHR